MDLKHAKLLQDIGLGDMVRKLSQQENDSKTPVEPQTVPSKKPVKLEVLHGVSKKCPLCKEIKLLDDFKAKNSYSGYCKPCRNEYQNNLNTLKRKDSTGICPICKLEAKMVFDHNHITNEPRGMICRACNTGLGMFKDDIGFLSNAIAYLIKYNK